MLRAGLELIEIALSLVDGLIGLILEVTVKVEKPWTGCCTTFYHIYIARVILSRLCGSIFVC